VSTALAAAYSRHVAGDLDGALAYYTTGLRGAQRPEPWFSVASLLSDRGQREAALVCARKALAADPGHPDALKNLGCILYRMQRFAEARMWLEAAIALRPSDHEIAFNLGATCYSLGELADAERWFIEAVCTAPSDAHHARALTQLAYPILAAGDYRRGLCAYEHRFAEIGRTQVWELGIPEWQGEDLGAKHILVHHDQGTGDDIQFVRFLGLLAERAEHVTLAVPRDLLGLFRWPFWFPALNNLKVVDIEGDLPTADYHSAICSYPRHLDLELPPQQFSPYIAGSPAELEKPPGTQLTIGLVWAPRPLGEISARRSVPLGLLLELAAIPGVALYSLQVGAAARDLEAGPGVLVQDLSRQLRDWRDTAAYMSALDLIVSVDSAPLHLAGAMGLPCVGLLPYVPCWRWGFHTDRTPWYPSMRLLRQAAPGDWRTPLHQLRNLVQQRLGRETEERSDGLDLCFSGVPAEHQRRHCGGESLHA